MNYIRPSDCSKLFFDDIAWISTTTPIYHLEFCKRPILIRTLIDIINYLPNLDSLKISSVSIVKAKRLSKKEKELIDAVTNYNKITKVYLENMIKFKEISHLIDLFPQMKYLQIGLTNDNNVKLVIQSLLKKIMKKNNQVLRSFGFCISMADEKMVKNIQKMIDSIKLIFHYKIKRMCDTIYLQWE
jgi:hypothetical protein